MTNVLLLVADDCAAHACGFMGGPAQTPNLDALGAEGTIFNKVFANGTACKPMRTTLLTGLYPTNHGQMTNHTVHHGAPGAATFLPKKLRNAGFKTFHYGKYHVPQYSPDLAGFEQYVTGSDASWGGALDVMKNLPGGQPWFLQMSFHEPHSPWLPKPRYLGLYPDPLTNLPGNWGAPRVNKPAFQDFQESRVRQNLIDDGLDPDDLNLVYRHYCAFISQLDDKIGALTGILEDRGQKDDTIIIFTSDQGMLINNHNLTFKAAICLEEMLHVPLIMRWPGQIPAGARTDRLTELIDVPASILDMLGIPVPGAWDGVPLTEPKGFAVTQTRIEAHPPTNGEVRSVRIEDTQSVFRLTLHENDVDELYNLTEDPYELINLGPSHWRFQPFKNLFIQWMVDHNDPAANVFP